VFCGIIELLFDGLFGLVVVWVLVWYLFCGRVIGCVVNLVGIWCRVGFIVVMVVWFCWG